MNHKKIAVLATTIHPVKQRHLIDWFCDISSIDFHFKVFTQQKISKAYRLNRFKLKFKIHLLEYALQNFKPGVLLNPQKNRFRPITDFNPDLIHLLTSHTFEDIDEYFEQKNTKLIISFRGYDLYIKPLLSESNLVTLKSMFEVADCLHFISHDLMKRAIEYGAPMSKCKVIYRSINTDSLPDLNRLSEIRREIEIPVIITTARLVWEKGFLCALKALHILKTKGFEFRYLIVGDGNEREQLEIFVKENHLINDVSFLGELPHERIFELLETSTIYLQTSNSEALSNSIIEASYYGLPVVATKVGGIPEVVEHGVTGLLSESDDYLDISVNLIKLIKDIELRKLMGIEGQKRVATKFSRKDEIFKWNQLYKDIIDG